MSLWLSEHRLSQITVERRITSQLWSDNTEWQITVRSPMVAQTHTAISINGSSNLLFDSGVIWKRWEGISVGAFGCAMFMGCIDNEENTFFYFVHMLLSIKFYFLLISLFLISDFEFQFNTLFLAFQQLILFAFVQLARLTAHQPSTQFERAVDTIRTNYTIYLYILLFTCFGWYNLLIDCSYSAIQSSIYKNTYLQLNTN